MDDWIKGWINGLFGGLNGDLKNATSQITMSPADAFGQKFWETMLSIGTTVIMPFAITLMCYAMAAELYHVYVKSNGHLDLELVSSTFFKFVLPFILITKTYDLIKLIFTVVNALLTQLSGALTSGELGGIVDPSALETQLSNMDFWGKLGLMVELWPMALGMKIMGIVITVIVYGRLFEIVLYWIFSPIPLSMLMHSEFSQIGKNFIKMFVAILLQGGFMVLCVAMYAILIRQHVFSASFAEGWSILTYSAVLVFVLTKTGSLSKRMLGVMGG